MFAALSLLPLIAYRIEFWYVKQNIKLLLTIKIMMGNNIMQAFMFPNNTLKSLALLDTKDLYEVCCKITITL